MLYKAECNADKAQMQISIHVGLIVLRLPREPTRHAATPLRSLTLPSHISNPQQLRP
jgi:hypothetical protein